MKMRRTDCSNQPIGEMLNSFNMKYQARAEQMDSTKTSEEEAEITNDLIDKGLDADRDNSNSYESGILSQENPKKDREDYFGEKVTHTKKADSFPHTHIKMHRTSYKRKSPFCIIRELNLLSSSMFKHSSCKKKCCKKR